MVNALLTFVILSTASAAVQNFYVRDTNGNNCIVLEAEPTFTVKFVVPSKNTTESYETKIGKITNVTGDCHAVYGNNESAQTLTVSFLPEGYSAKFAKEWILELVFGTPAKESYKLVDYTLTTQQTEKIKYFGDFIKDPKAKETVSASEENCYKCSNSNLDLAGGSQVHLKNLRVVAFGNINGTLLPANTPYELCLQDTRTSDLVPIIVGACLAALVIIVLCAYLVGRARAKRAGYASV